MNLVWYKNNFIPVFDQIIECKGGYVGLMYDKPSWTYYLYLDKNNELKPKMQMGAMIDEMILKLHKKSDVCIEVLCNEDDGRMVPFLEFNTETEKFTNTYKVRKDLN